MALGEIQELARLEQLGISYDDVIETLEVEGVEKFEDSWNQLIEAVTDQIEKAGADVSPSGSTSPAGSGPAAASRSGSAK